MARMERIGSLAEFGEGAARAVDVAGRQIAVFNVGGKLYAIDNACTHVGAPLAEGEVDELTVICPWHHAEFDLRTGQALCPPAGGPVACYPVHVDGDDVRLQLPD